MTKGKEELRQLKIERAKRTAFGRMLCRLFGDDAGQAMMEYVIIGVMIAAAAVAIVLVFGTEIRSSFNAMIIALGGNPNKAQNARQASSTANQSAAAAALTTGSNLATGGGGTTGN